MKLVINVYDKKKSCNQKGADQFGVGIYHSGVEIYGKEFAFGGNSCMKQTGVYELRPRNHNAFEFKTSITIGDLDPKDFPAALNGKISYQRDIWPIINEVSDKYRAYKYNMLMMNCNHFSDEIIHRLFKGKRRLPGWINRAAYIGSWFHCVVPTKYIIVTPAGQEDEAMANIQRFKQEEEEEKERKRTRSMNSSTSSSTAENSGSQSISEWGSQVIDTFYTSITSRSAQSDTDRT